MKKVLFSLFVAALSVYQATAQEIPVGTPFISDCGGFFVDPGMSASDYGPNILAASVICSDATVPGQINLAFSFFNLGAGDQLSIFNGNDASAELIGTYGGTDLNGITISSSNPSNCLTVVFSSDADASVGSFGAEISCGIPCVPPVVAVTTDQPDFQPTRLCVGEVMTFDASSTVFGPGSVLASHTWDFDDGTTDVTSWPIVTHSFSESGAYMVELMVLDTNGCGNINLIDALILVDTEPSISIAADDFQACLGQEINLAVSIDPTYWSALPTANLGGALFIPDDQTQCFSDTIYFGGFNAGQSIQSETDLENFFVNFEHSYMGDIVISFVCPNGQSMIVHQQGGAGTLLGEPIDILGPADPAGVGYDYFWSPTATAGTWLANSGGGTLPSGSYNSVEPFTNLIGCPLNGAWIVEVCDMFGSDDGWIFDWSVNFAPELYPPLISFTPSFGYTCDSITWTGPGIVNTIANCGGAVLNPTTPGDYYIIVSALNNFGCTYTDTIGVNYFAPPVLDLGNDIPYCLNSVNLLSNVTGQVPGVNYVYDWSVVSANGGSFNASNIPFPSFSGATGTSELTLSVHPIDDIQCTVTDNINLITPETPGTGTFTTDSVCLSEQIFLSAPFTYPSYTYQWFLSDTIVPNALASVYSPWAGVPNEQFMYSVEITEPICGFSSVTDFGVTSLPCDVFLPNIILPNGTTENQTLNFGEALFYYANASVEVYNRWGDLVYESTDYKNDWAPNDVSDGVFYYILKVTTPTGKVEDYPGYFHLMRN
jgi:subtilisin-like proprotein convertase family protein